MQRNRSRITQISQIGRPSTAETVTLLRNSKANSKAKSTYDYGSSSSYRHSRKNIQSAPVQPKPIIPRIKYFSIKRHSRQNDRRLVTWTAFTISNATLFEQREVQCFTFKRTRNRYKNQSQDTSYLAYPPPTTRKEENQVCCTDTDTGILPGLTRKCNMRSKFR